MENCTSTGQYIRFCKNPKGPGLYRPQKSRTKEETGKRFEIVYGTGAATGPYYRDVFAVRFLPGILPSHSRACSWERQGTKQLKLKRKVMFGGGELRNGVDDDVASSACRSRSPARAARRSFEQIVREGHLRQPVFTTYLTKCGKAHCQQGGVITFGGIDGRRRSVGEDRPPLRPLDLPDGRLLLISDSGSSELFIPQPLANQIFRLVNAQKGKDDEMYVKCRLKIRVAILIAGRRFVVDERQLIVPATTRPRTCRIAISGHTDPFFLFGDPFARTYCQVHDLQRRRIGFAKAKLTQTRRV
ncbi:Peptidase A1 domain-containing protein [Aphelenchoides fujianensis]|nr:Peptidase A1 domain-containing protein [Aphelenchoides fujianensis]